MPALSESSLSKTCLGERLARQMRWILQTQLPILIDRRSNQTCSIPLYSSSISDHRFDREFSIFERGCSIIVLRIYCKYIVQ
eukprot:m.118642 g.118642  ORF g.118642 m.118642 type:complete len:82 (+) comp37654_c0_seq2:333-578(+)